MSDRQDRPNEAADRRKARLAEQLRANLQRRKAQTRQRSAGDTDPPLAEDGSETDAGETPRR